MSPPATCPCHRPPRGEGSRGRCHAADPSPCVAHGQPARPALHALAAARLATGAWIAKGTWERCQIASPGVCTRPAASCGAVLWPRPGCPPPARPRVDFNTLERSKQEASGQQREERLATPADRLGGALRTFFDTFGRTAERKGWHEAAGLASHRATPCEGLHCWCVARCRNNWQSWWQQCQPKLPRSRCSLPAWQHRRLAVPRRPTACRAWQYLVGLLLFVPRGRAPDSVAGKRAADKVLPSGVLRGLHLGPTCHASLPYLPWDCV